MFSVATCQHVNQILLLIFYLCLIKEWLWGSHSFLSRSDISMIKWTVKIFFTISGLRDMCEDPGPWVSLSAWRQERWLRWSPETDNVLLWPWRVLRVSVLYPLLLPFPCPWTQTPPFLLPCVKSILRRIWFCVWGLRSQVHGCVSFIKDD